MNKAQRRKNQILDAAQELILEKGVDGTSTGDILEKVGIARGTLYHHFKSKDEIIDCLIERMSLELIQKANVIAQDEQIPADERLLLCFMALKVGEENQTITDYLHHPQNALMHQKTQYAFFQKIPPILAKIVEDGVQEGIFDTTFPLESTEMLCAYLDIAFDEVIVHSAPERTDQKMNALRVNMERLLGAKTGSFTPLFERYNGK